MNLNYDFDRQEKREKLSKIIFCILRWILVLGLTVGAAKLVVTFAVEITNMVGSSMETTISNDEMILINKLAYIKDAPERFDVIVFQKNGKEHSYYLIRRIIGMPGETVQIMDGEVYIDGRHLTEVAVVDRMNLSGLAEKKIVLDDDEYFVLGDNRNDSEDSRFANIGNVVSSEIIGKAWIRIKPFGIIETLNLQENVK